MDYSDGFKAAWKSYHAGSTKAEKGRSDKVESYKRWNDRGLEGLISNVLARLKTLPEVYSPGYRPGFEVFLKKHDYTEPLEPTEPESEATGDPSVDLEDWGSLISRTKSKAKADKRMHPKNPYLYPETIVLAVRDIARGDVAGPPEIERVMEVAQARADKVKAGVRPYGELTR